MGPKAEWKPVKIKIKLFKDIVCKYDYILLIYLYYLTNLLKNLIHEFLEYFFLSLGLIEIVTTCRN